MERVNIINSNITVANFNDAIKEIEKTIQNKRGSNYICFSNVHTVVTGKKDKKLQIATNSACMALPDGMPLSWIQKLRGLKNVSKCSGPDIMRAILDISETKGFSHYFFGSDDNTLNLMKSKLEVEYPSLIIKGYYSPPFREMTFEENEAFSKLINELKPDFIWIGLGAPKQEKWMYENVNKFDSSLLLGVGAAFNFYAGTVKRAPLWMQRTGLEWSYRLFIEPRRLFIRYFKTNFLFIYYLIKEKFVKQVT